MLDFLSLHTVNNVKVNNFTQVKCNFNMPCLFDTNITVNDFQAEFLMVGES